MRAHRGAVGVRPRDELQAWSDAPLVDDLAGRIPPLTMTPPPGRTVTVDGLDVFVRHTDHGAPGRDAWFLHGLDGSADNWNRIAQVLADEYPCWAPDLPGSGRSSPAGAALGLTDEAHLVAALIRRMSDGPVHLVGNSRGGYVATLLAARWPELVASLTLISPAVPDLRLVRDRGADPRLALVLLPQVAAWASRALPRIDAQVRAEGLARICFGEPEALSPADLEVAAVEYRRRARSPWMARAAVQSLRSLVRAHLSPGATSFAAAARAVRVPTLVVWGARDLLVDVRLSRPTARLFSDRRLLVLPRTGHVAQMERPRTTARAMLHLWRGVDAGAPRPAPTADMGA